MDGAFGPLKGGDDAWVDMVLSRVGHCQGGKREARFPPPASRLIASVVPRSGET
jgi:hypothetical protein